MGCSCSVSRFACWKIGKEWLNVVVEIDGANPSISHIPYPCIQVSYDTTTVISLSWFILKLFVYVVIGASDVPANECVIDCFAILYSVSNLYFHDCFVVLRSDV